MVIRIKRIRLDVVDASIPRCPWQKSFGHIATREYDAGNQNAQVVLPAGHEFYDMEMVAEK